MKGSPTRRRRLAVTGLVLLGVFGALLVISTMVSDWATSLFFAPIREHEGSPRDHGVEVKAGTLAARDGSPLDTWWFPARTEGGRRPVAVVVHAHGNGSNLSGHWPLSAGLTERGFHVLAFDYRGFGRSPGKASRRRAVEDLQSVLDHATARAAEQQLPVVVLGQPTTRGGVAAPAALPTHPTNHPVSQSHHQAQTAVYPHQIVR